MELRPALRQFEGAVMKTVKSGLFVAALTLATVNLSVEVIAEGHSSRLEELSDLRLPDGGGPYPMVAIIPGCSGFKWPFYERAGSKLRNLGFATARVDYVAARSQGGCSDEVSHDEVAEDVLYLLSSLAARNDIKPKFVNVLAWSSGGGGALQILSKNEPDSGVSIAAVAVYSPQCLGVEPWSAEIPVLMFLGAKDVIAPASYCRKLVDLASGSGEIRIEEFENAYHGFDDSDLPTNSGNMRYNAVAADKAWDELINFLVH